MNCIFKHPRTVGEATEMRLTRQTLTDLGEWEAVELFDWQLGSETEEGCQCCGLKTVALTVEDYLAELDAMGDFWEAQGE